MKAATLYQPWATLVAIREKKIETRSWKTTYRGSLAIHAGMEKKFIDMGSKYCVCTTEPFYSVLMEATPPGPYYKVLPRGAIIAICALVDCLLIEPGSPCIMKDGRPDFLSDQEKAFGDYTPGRFMWVLEEMVKLKRPIPAKGGLGLWEWTPPGDLEFK